MKIIGKLLSAEKLNGYIGKKKISRKIDKIILHHTFDSILQWKRGEISVNYYKKMYEKKGWLSGPHFFVAPEGIWFFTDTNTQGTHANDGNKRSIGIEMVGRYDRKVPSGKIWKNTKKLIMVLIEKFQLKSKDIHFHREYNTQKSCPGRAITKKWLKQQMRID